MAHVIAWKKQEKGIMKRQWRLGKNLQIEVPYDQQPVDDLGSLYRTTCILNDPDVPETIGKEMRYLYLTKKNGRKCFYTAVAELL